MMHDRPSAAELERLIAVAEEASAQSVAFARAVIAAERAAAPTAAAAWTARLAALVPGVPPDVAERRLAAEIRDLALVAASRRAAIRAHLAATVRAKLAVTAPECIATFAMFAPAVDSGGGLPLLSPHSLRAGDGE